MVASSLSFFTPGPDTSTPSAVVDPESLLESDVDDGRGTFIACRSVHICMVLPIAYCTAICNIDLCTGFTKFNSVNDF